MAEIQSGTLVRVRTADDKWLDRIAISTVVNGADFPVVWVVADDEYNPRMAGLWQDRAARARHGSVHLPGMPWPDEDVVVRDRGPKVEGERG